jgi:hypothetical protein
VPIFQRTIPREREGCGVATACGIIQAQSVALRSGMSQKKMDDETISMDAVAEASIVGIGILHS